MNFSVILVTITVSEPDRDLAGGSSWGLGQLSTWFMCMQDRDHLK
jgi:hypothetical protein